MKKTVLFYSCIFVLLFCCLSCVTNINKKNSDGSPIWTVEIPKSNKKLYGIGKAKFSTDSISETASETNAKANLAKQLQSTMNNFTTVYSNGTEDDEIKAFEQLTIEVVNFTLKGVAIEDKWKSENGTYWVLVSVKVKDIPSFYESVASSMNESGNSIDNIKVNVELYLENKGFDLTESTVNE